MREIIICNDVHEDKNWLSRNKKRVLITVSIIVIAVVVFTIFKNLDATANKLSAPNAKLIEINKSKIMVNGTIPLFEGNHTTPESINKIMNGGEEFLTKEHIRNLPLGWHASHEKIVQAEEHGFTPGEHQTWVENYIKNDKKE